ncbi:DNA mismatch repair protein MutS [Granulicella sp. L46]|uniref:MutS-related protein n=1 Tax=Granulicella sp. L46 TaxID=1641865 RepID=UPI00131CE7E9|nr:DNA mismatch repair protein MutS [Granulicella sp. L46]
MAEAMVAAYEERKAAANGAYAKAKSSQDGYRLAVLGLVGVAVRTLWVAITRGHGYWTVAVVIVILAGMVVWMLRIGRQVTRAWRLAALYEKGLKRLSGEVRWSGLTGEAFAVEGHLYERDLDVLGTHSLFDLLATTRTVVGQSGLARVLLEPTNAATVRERQAAVKELAGMLDLRERVAMVGRSRFEDVPVESFELWLEGERGAFPGWVRWALGLATVAWIAVGVAAWRVPVDRAWLLRLMESLLLAQGMICAWLMPKVKAELEAAQLLIGQMSILREGLGVMCASEFASERLRALQRAVAGEDRAVRQLERSLMVVEHRSKEWMYPVSVTLAMGTQVAISLDAWKQRFEEPMRQWLDAWGEFEALLALATYAAEHEENVWPEIVDGAALFAAKGMVHPLLWRKDAVANDVALGGEVQFLLISGSNMAGKSTLLRAIGANAVLALAGASVPARGLRMSALQIGASLAINDSLAEGKSKFLAEVERLRDLLALARDKPGESLFLIDEVFSGTNSLDRRVAAEAVLRGLLAAGAIGALSTHDLALAELAEIAALGGRNVHMASPDESDPLGFDYLLKAGVNRTMNGLAIVRLLGMGDLSKAKG